MSPARRRSLRGGWQAPLLDQEAGGVLFEKTRKMDALLAGRRNVIGSPNLVQSLVRFGLIDRLNLWLTRCCWAAARRETIWRGGNERSVPQAVYSTEKPRPRR
jgi:hypothetical protein